MGDHPAKAVEPRRVADIFESPDETQQARGRIVRQREDGRNRAHQIEHAAKGLCPGQPGPQLAIVLAAGPLRRRVQPQHVFKQEECRNGIKGHFQRRFVGFVDRCHRRGEHHRDPRRDNPVMHGAEDPRGRARAVRGQHKVQATPVHRAILKDRAPPQE